MVNCTEEAPYTEDYVNGMSPVVLAFIVFLSLLTVATCVFFVELWVYLSRNVNSTEVKGHCLIVLGLLPAISIVSQLGMTVPRTAVLAELISSVSTGMALFAFLHLTVAYLGGKVEMLEQMQRVDSVLNVSPFCCCLCLPRIRISRFNFPGKVVLDIALTFTAFILAMIQIFSVGQNATMFLIPIMHFIVGVLWADGKYFKEKVDIHNPVFYIRIAMFISTLLSIYVFRILIETGLQIADQTCHLLPKYIIVMAVVIINNIQPLFIEVLTAYNVIPCTDVFSWIGRGSVFNHMGTVAEAFILMLFSRRFYRKPYPPVETLALPSNHSLCFSQ